ncbi:MAG: GTP 3',8-cyclase MoaA [Desulfobacterales bacterium]|nr:MAG: GTP 3',8-cyclase MoaA [Desulfobacterales bacterium]
MDNCNRHLNYLRVSITDRCNLQCLYCVPRELMSRLAQAEILRYEEILRIIRVGVSLGISKVRVTGGEPLVRKGVYEFLAKLTQTPGLNDVSLTTNGVFLQENLVKIKSAGITRINVSLDTLNPQKFEQITGRDVFSQVWQGIEAARAMNFNPIKINVVALNGVNEDEIIDFARLTFAYPYHIRFIEYMPIGKSGIKTGPLLLAPEIKKRIRVLGKLTPVRKTSNDGPAQRYKLEGAQGELGFIHALSRHFCEQCNRLRLTASGQLRPCLLSSDYHEDLKGPLRSGCSDEELAGLFLKAVQNKPSDHNLAVHRPEPVCGQMSAIGG